MMLKNASPLSSFIPPPPVSSAPSLSAWLVFLHALRATVGHLSQNLACQVDNRCVSSHGTFLPFFHSYLGLWPVLVGTMGEMTHSREHYTFTFSQVYWGVWEQVHWHKIYWCEHRCSCETLNCLWLDILMFCLHVCNAYTCLRKSVCMRVQEVAGARCSWNTRM